MVEEDANSANMTQCRPLLIGFVSLYELFTNVSVVFRYLSKVFYEDSMRCAPKVSAPLHNSGCGGAVTH